MSEHNFPGSFWPTAMFVHDSDPSLPGSLASRNQMNLVSAQAGRVMLRNYDRSFKFHLGTFITEYSANALKTSLSTSRSIIFPIL